MVYPLLYDIPILDIKYSKTMFILRLNEIWYKCIIMDTCKYVNTHIENKKTIYHNTNNDYLSLGSTIMGNFSYYIFKHSTSVHSVGH